MYMSLVNTKPLTLPGHTGHKASHLTRLRSFTQMNVFILLQASYISNLAQSVTSHLTEVFHPNELLLYLQASCFPYVPQSLTSDLAGSLASPVTTLTMWLASKDHALTILSN